MIELAARWYVFILLNIYGVGKIAGGQFYRRGRPPASKPLHWNPKAALTAVGAMALLFTFDQLLASWFGHGKG